MRDSRVRLLDMLEAIENIERYAARGRRAFEDDELIQIWIIHYLQIIGEAAARLGHDFHDAHPGPRLFRHRPGGSLVGCRARPARAQRRAARAPQIARRERPVKPLALARSSQILFARLDRFIWANLGDIGYGQ